MHRKYGRIIRVLIRASLERFAIAHALKFFERLHGAALEGQTFSAGVAESDGTEEDRQVVQRADRALYRAKAEGRNRTLLAETLAEAA